jgi:PilZ domain
VSDTGGTNPGGTERRNAVRIKTEGALQAQLLLDVDSDVQSLSAAGMMVRLDLPLEVGTRQRFTLVLDQTSFDVSGLVRNCRRAAGAGSAGYEIGVEFEELEPEVRDQFERFVQKKIEG